MEYLSDGITDSLINSLVDLKKIRLAPRSLVFRYKGPDVDPHRAGLDLNVRAVLTGRIALRGETLVIGTELLDVAGVSQIWGTQYTRKFADVLVLQEEIAREISNKLRLQLSGEEKKRLAKRPAQDKETYQLYLKALYFSNRWSVENLKKAAEYARRALDLDPTCAPAYAVLASASSMLGFYGFVPPADAFPQARSAALKAIELDDRLPDAHSTLALVLLLHYWDWEGCGRECRRALELNGDSPLSLHIYALYSVSQGHLPEAAAAWGKAVEVDPITPVWNFGLGLSYFFLHQYQQAIEQFRKTLDLDSTHINSQEFWTICLVFQRKYEEAIAAAEKISNFPGGAGPCKAILGYCNASAGRQQEARACLEELIKHPDGNPFTAYFTAILCTALQQSDQAFALLYKLCERRFPPLYAIKVIPLYDSLHSDPRFAGLLQRIGLPE